MSAEQPIKPVKRGFWSWIHQVYQNNRDLDSSNLILFIGGGTILNQIFCFLKPEYAKTAAAVEITRLYATAIVMMVMYFFKKGGDGNGQSQSAETEVK